MAINNSNYFFSLSPSILFFFFFSIHVSTSSGWNTFLKERPFFRRDRAIIKIAQHRSEGKRYRKRSVKFPFYRGQLSLKRCPRVDTLFENSPVTDNVVEFLPFLLLNVSAAHLLLNRLDSNTIRALINGQPRRNIYDLGSTLAQDGTRRVPFFGG